MDRNTFETTQERLTIERTPRIPLHTKVLMALWLLGNQESFRGVGDRFGINKGLLHYVVNNIIELWAATCAALCWEERSSEKLSVRTSGSMSFLSHSQELYTNVADLEGCVGILDEIGAWYSALEDKLSISL
ncbi:hypothetical protein HPB49_000843 [Dermacentor silvarum]|uniref:Uncharacterized protein n=1 Tax=Dermacentor silvarum TaxID=543639 RepID=A0ACB8CNU2_DERSI|nr:hypothetical protein HPB49_000843 [Dermacentor silvarum]